MSYSKTASLPRRGVVLEAVLCAAVSPPKKPSLFYLYHSTVPGYNLNNKLNHIPKNNLYVQLPPTLSRCLFSHTYIKPLPYPLPSTTAKHTMQYLLADPVSVVMMGHDEDHGKTLALGVILKACNYLTTALRYLKCQKTPLMPPLCLTF